MPLCSPRSRDLVCYWLFKNFLVRAFSDRLGVRNAGSLEPAGPSFFGRIFEASVHRNKLGRYRKPSNYQTRESPDEDGLICRNVGPNIPIKNSFTEISMLTRRNILVTA